MSQRRAVPLLVAGLVLAAVAATAFGLPGSAADAAAVLTASDETVAPAEPQVAEVKGDVQPGSAPEVKLPAAFYRKLAPRSRIPLRLPDGIKSGLRCPDGTYLPLLNGVPHAYPLNRPARNGPLPPVVAKVTDWGGYEWYEHADGSHTTTRWTPMRTAGGETRLEVVTDHEAPYDSRFGMPPELGPRVNGSSPPAK